MTEIHDEFLTFLQPTPSRPLLGQTILAVEDSRCAGEALRLFARASGARFRRADSLRAAARHLTTYMPTVTIIDLGLPDGQGLDLVRDLATGCRAMQAVVATSGDAAARDAALGAGADGFLEKPVASLAEFQTFLLSLLPVEARPRKPRALPQDPAHVDPVALNDDLAHAADLFSSAEADGTIDYLAGFLAGVGRCAGDAQLTFCAERLRDAVNGGHPVARNLATLASMVQERLARPAAV